MSSCANNCISHCKNQPHKKLSSSGSTVVPLTTHQDNVLSAIRYCLLMPCPEFEAYTQHNDGFGKLIRNFQYWVQFNPPPGISPYKNDRMGRIYFRRTFEAECLLNIGGSAGKGGGVHYEHAVPVNLIQKELEALRKLHPTGVAIPLIAEVVKASEIILVTHKQQKRLDSAEGTDVEQHGWPKGTKGLGLQRKPPAPWKPGDCHLARIWEITDEVVGPRLIGC